MKSTRELVMKYFTREWYELCQKTFAHLPLKESKEAEHFSEDYFQELYKQKLSNHLSIRKRMENTAIEFPPFKLDPIYTKQMTDKQIQEVEEEIIARQEKIIQNRKQYKYNEEKSLQEFEKLLMSGIERVKSKLPEEILDDIADIRVFVLNKATKGIIAKVKAFCEKNEKLVQQVQREYQTYYSEIEPMLDKDIVEYMNFHDCKVERMSSHEGMLDIHLDNIGGFTDVNRVRLENSKVISQNGSLEKAWWLYDEIYIVENGYEIHVLLKSESRDLSDFVFFAQHIKFFRD